MVYSTSKLLLVLALVCFVLATFGVALPIIQLVPLGLAFLCASFIVP